MSYITVSDLKTKITGKLNGASLAKVNDVYGKISEGASNVILRLDPVDTIRRYRIENAIHDQIYNYVAPSDFKGKGNIVDFRPIGPRGRNDYNDQVFNREFDIRKMVNSLSVETVNGVNTLKINKSLTARTILSELDSLTIGATVTGDADIANLELDYLDYITGSASVKFDLLGGGQGKITIALANTVDLSKMEDIGALFHWFKFPDASDLTSVVLRYGNDSSNYFEKTITSPHDRDAFEDNAWVLNRYDWSSSTETGSVDTSAIDHIEIIINYTNAQSNVKIDSITASIGEAYEMLYYSNCLFRSADGTTYKTVPTADTDVILLNTDGINILLYECMGIFGQEVKGQNQAKNLNFFERKLEGDSKKPGLYSLYEGKYPSEAIPVTTNYYEFGWGDQEDFEEDY